MNETLLAKQIEITNRYNFGLIFLSYSALALEIQYASALNKYCYNWILIISFICFFLSGTINGVRVTLRLTSSKGPKDYNGMLWSALSFLIFGFMTALIFASIKLIKN